MHIPGNQSFSFLTFSQACEVFSFYFSIPWKSKFVLLNSSRSKRVLFLQAYCFCSNVGVVFSYEESSLTRFAGILKNEVMLERFLATYEPLPFEYCYEKHKILKLALIDSYHDKQVVHFCLLLVLDPVILISVDCSSFN